jgi:zinc transport system permease protein
MDRYFIPVILTSIIGGGALGLLGSIILGMRVPFLGIYISHGAMLGAVIGAIFGINQMAISFAVALISALVLGTFTTRESKQNEDISVGILFSVSMALVFLGMGIAQNRITDMLSLLWGSILFVRISSFVLVCVGATALAVFFYLFNKELKAIVFSRVLAAASGIRETFVWMVFLILSSLIITSNLSIVGGLMIYSLITNPPAAAFKLCKGFTKAAILSAIFGAASGLGGFIISYVSAKRVPVGACIALFSAAIYVTAVIIRRFSSR